MNRKLAIAAASLAAIAAFGGALFAAERAGLARGPFARMVRANLGRLLTLKEELNVTPQQRESIRKAVLAHKKEGLDALRAVRAERKKLAEAARAEKTDEAAIRAAAEAAGKAAGDLAVLAAKIRKEVLPLLTEDQRKKIEEFRSEVEASIDRALEEADKMD